MSYMGAVNLDNYVPSKLQDGDTLASLAALYGTIAQNIVANNHVDFASAAIDRWVLETGGKKLANGQAVFTSNSVIALPSGGPRAASSAGAASFQPPAPVPQTGAAGFHYVETAATKKAAKDAYDKVINAGGTEKNAAVASLKVQIAAKVAAAKAAGTNFQEVVAIQAAADAARRAAADGGMSTAAKATMLVGGLGALGLLLVFLLKKKKTA